MKSSRIVVALAAALVAAAPLAFADAASSRQERMDAAYQNYLRTHGGSSAATGSAASHGELATTPSNGGSSGHIGQDVKTMGRGMKKGWNDTTRRVGKAAHEQVESAKEVGKETKDKITGK